MQNAAPTVVVRDRTPFIGRERERALLRAELEGRAGLLTLTGPSGIGKTRLARQVVDDLHDEGRSSDGPFRNVHFCELGSCRGTADMEAAAARILGLPDKHGRELAQAISKRGRILLILDNLDRVARELGPVLGTWLDLCPELHLIATSIVPIELEGEVRFELGPLDAADAVALYRERAHRASAGRVFPEGDEAVLEELVGRLDRIPLAIELAAARVRVLPPRALLSRIGERFTLLRSGSGGRHGSLLQALTLTWELLSPEEQTILANASVFAGGFTLEAAAAVMDDVAGDPLDLLDGIRSKALLSLDEGDPPRFLLFEAARDYAKGELERAGRRAELVRRHATYLVEKGEEQLPRLEGLSALEAIAWLKAERENLVAILSRADELDPSLVARAGLVLCALLDLEGFPSASLHLLETAQEAARRSGDPRLIARIDAGWAMAILPQGRVDEAIAPLEEGRRSMRQAGDREEEGNVLVRLAFVHLRRGEVEKANQLFDEAVELGREAKAPLLEAWARLNRGAGAHALLDIETAERCYEEALPILREHGFRRREGIALSLLAGVRMGQGRFRESRRALHDALARCRETGNRRLEAAALMNMGSTDHAAGLLDDAERASLEALDLQREIGNRRGEGIVLGTLGCVALERGQLPLADRRLNESVGLLEECGDRRFHASALPFLAVVEARRGRAQEAQKSLKAARAYFDEVNDRASLLMAEIIEGSLELAEARRLAPTRNDEAERLVERARARLTQKKKEKAHLTAWNLIEASRLLQQDLEDWDAGARAVSVQGQEEGLRVGPEANWFELPGQERVDLRRRVAIRRMLDALVDQRLGAPGVGLDPHQLFEKGWPQVEIDPEAAIRRVYLGIWTLRDLGLSDALLNQTDGYLLDPKVPLLRQRD